jgi:hypothetical protein
MESITIAIIVVLLILAYFLYTYYQKSQELTRLLGEKTKSLAQKVQEYQELKDKHDTTVADLEKAKLEILARVAEINGLKEDLKQLEIAKNAEIAQLKSEHAAAIVAKNAEITDLNAKHVAKVVALNTAHSGAIAAKNAMIKKLKEDHSAELVLLKAKHSNEIAAKNAEIKAVEKTRDEYKVELDRARLVLSGTSNVLFKDYLGDDAKGVAGLMAIRDSMLKIINKNRSSWCTDYKGYLPKVLHDIAILKDAPYLSKQITKYSYYAVSAPVKFYFLGGYGPHAVGPSNQAVLSKDAIMSWATNVQELVRTTPYRGYIIGMPNDYTKVLTISDLSTPMGFYISYQPYIVGNPKQMWNRDSNGKMTNSAVLGHSITAIDGTPTSRLMLQKDGQTKDPKTQQATFSLFPRGWNNIQSDVLLPPQPHLSFSGSWNQTVYYETPEMQGSGMNTVGWDNLCKPENVTNVFTMLDTDQGLYQTRLYPFMGYGREGKIDALQLIDELEAIVLRKHGKMCPSGKINFDVVVQIAQNIGEMICVPDDKFNAMFGNALDHLLSNAYKTF